jgi:putative restriction endonuclease
MVKLVLLHREDSIYEDQPDVVYDFPRPYLKAASEAVGDWIVYYEPVKAGPRGYFAVAQIDRVIPKPGVEGRFLAMIAPGTRRIRRTCVGIGRTFSVGRCRATPRRGDRVMPRAHGGRCPPWPFLRNGPSPRKYFRNGEDAGNTSLTGAG